LSLKGKIAVVTALLKALVLLSQKNLQKIMGRNSHCLFKEYSKSREIERVAGQINGKAFAAEIDLTSNSSVRSFFAASDLQSQ
jgi:hypothetical protein